MSTAGDTAYLASGLYAQIFAEAIIAYSDANIISRLVNAKGVQNADTASWQVVNRGTNKLDSSDLGAVTDGSEIAATAVNTDKKTATLAPFAVRTDVYDDTKYSNISDQAAFVGGLLGNAASAYVDKQLAELFSDFNATGDAGTSSIGMTVDNLYSALGFLRLYGARGMPRAVFHPSQIVGTYGLMNDLVTSDQFGGTPDLQNQGLKDAWVDRIAGIDVFQSLEVETHGSTSAYGGVFVKDAIGLAYKEFAAGQPFWIEKERHATYERDVWMAHLFFNSIELDDYWGCMIDTKIA